MNDPRRKRRPEVVIDTNLFVSGIILKRGLPFTLLESWRSQLFTLLLSQEQLAELQDVLSRTEILHKYHVSEDECTDLFFLLSTITIQVTPLGTLPLKVRDLKDEKILAAALGAEADFLITGDDDLLVLREHPKLGNLRIVTVRQFLEILGGYQESAE